MNRRGSLLIESMVAAGVVVIGLLSVYLGFIQIRRISVRNSETATAITLLNSQIDADLKVDYASLTDTSPATLSLTLLPNAILTRTVTTDSVNSIKHIAYVLTWSGGGGQSSIKGETELVATGLNND